MPAFVFVGQGPQLVDSVPIKWPASSSMHPGEATSCTLESLGLYALDARGRPWTLCRHLGAMFGDPRPPTWFLVDDLLSGRAARGEAEAA